MQHGAIVKVFDLDQDRREAYEERAAILEFDAGFSRAKAEMMALDMGCAPMKTTKEKG